MSKIVFLGDVFLGGDLQSMNSNFNLFEVIENGDVVLNLEQAISYDTTLTGKSTVFSHPKQLKKLVNHRKVIVSLANNHIHDNGLDGINQLTDNLEMLNIPSFGGGSNIFEASKAFFISENLLILGYCDYSKPYLNKVQVATQDHAGVNPFSYEKVIEDLKNIPSGCKVILYIHWGYENIMIPPPENVELAKKLLNLEKVHSIVGCHSHKINGLLEWKGKKCFFSLGNTLFPNFNFKPRVAMCYDSLKSNSVTFDYHPVFNETYKKWRYFNRVSIELILDKNTLDYSYAFLKQNKNHPILQKVQGIELILNWIIFKLLSILLTSPKSVYKLLYPTWKTIRNLLLYIRLMYFYIFKDKSMLKIHLLLTKK